MAIKFGKSKRPFKGLIYGVEGCGKSTLAADMPNPVFMAIEDGLSKITCAKWVYEEGEIDRVYPRAYEEFSSALDTVIKNPGDRKTIVLDGVDALDRLITEMVCRQNKWKSLADPGFGKGDQAAMMIWRELVSRLDEANRKGMNVVLIGHAATGNIVSTEGASYKKYRLAVTDAKVEGFLRGWADYYVFARFEPMLKETDKKTYGVGIRGARILHLWGTDSWEAKMRGEGTVPEKIPLSWSELERVLEMGDLTTEELRKELMESLDKLPEDKRVKLTTWLDTPGLTVKDLAKAVDSVKAAVAIKNG